MKIKNIYEEMIEFDNGTTMSSHHKQDCCEWHWANFETLASYNLNPKTGETINIKDIEFPNNIHRNIKLIPGEGFIMIASDGSKYFVPCYGENNGYYSTNLKLLIHREWKKDVTIDLTQCQSIH